MSSSDEPTSNVDAPSDYDQYVASFVNDCTCNHKPSAHDNWGCAPMYCECTAYWSWSSD